jgi:hypothetical protein
MSTNNSQTGVKNSAKDDILIIVGGHFTPDALGPEVYEEIRARAQARAQEYLDVFESLFLDSGVDAATLSRLHLPAFLRLLFNAAPERVRQIAERLFQQHDTANTDRAEDLRAEALPISIAETEPRPEAEREADERVTQRMERRRIELQELLKRV